MVERLQRVVQALLKRHGRTFAEELEIDIAQNTPSSLFRLLCAALLCSTRIRSQIAINAAQELTKQGWITPAQMVASAWESRVKALDRASYTRYDESTATWLGENAQMLLDRYQGDLRNLRSEAECQPEREHQLLQGFKGIKQVGADIFCREVQIAWDELFPFVDRKARKSAQKLGLPDDPQALSQLIPKREFTNLVAALIRVDLENDYEQVLAEASEG